MCMQVLYQNEPELREQLTGPSGPPGYEYASRLEYAFKIRNKDKPEEWHQAEDLYDIPPQEEIPEGAVDTMKKSWEAFTGKVSGKDQEKAAKKEQQLDDVIPDDMAGADSAKKKKGLAGMFNF